MAGLGSLRFGVAAISYAVGPAMVAALAEPGGERMALIVGIGGYHDVVAAITYLTTGYYRSAPGAAGAVARPSRCPLGVRPRRSASGARGPRPRPAGRDRRAKLADPDADIGQLAAGLGEGGRA